MNKFGELADKLYNCNIVLNRMILMKELRSDDNIIQLNSRIGDIIKELRDLSEGRIKQFDNIKKSLMEKQAKEKAEEILERYSKTYPKHIIELAKKFNKPEKEFLIREDGRIEWQCKHGVGHTVWYPPGSDGIHGCCKGRCCLELHKKKVK